jgi:hypothetical protein
MKPSEFVKSVLCFLSKVPHKPTTFFLKRGWIVTRVHVSPLYNTSKPIAAFTIVQQDETFLTMTPGPTFVSVKLEIGNAQLMNLVLWSWISVLVTSPHSTANGTTLPATVNTVSPQKSTIYLTSSSRTSSVIPPPTEWTINVRNLFMW